MHNSYQLYILWRGKCIIYYALKTMQILSLSDYQFFPAPSRGDWQSTIFPKLFSIPIAFILFPLFRLVCFFQKNKMRPLGVVVKIFLLLFSYTLYLLDAFCNSLLLVSFLALFAHLLVILIARISTFQVSSCASRFYKRTINAPSSLSARSRRALFYCKSVYVCPIFFFFVVQFASSLCARACVLMYFCLCRNEGMMKISRNSRSSPGGSLGLPISTKNPIHTIIKVAPRQCPLDYSSQLFRPSQLYTLAAT